MSAVDLVLIDGSSYLYRAFHALPNLTNSAGEPTGALHGVLTMINKLVREQPDAHVAVVFDAPGKTFRDELFSEYKANRPPMPDDLRSQVGPILEAVEAMGLPLLRVEGVEADDVIGTLCKEAAGKDQSVLVSTGDKDLAQLMGEDDVFWDFAGKGKIRYDQVADVFGVMPEQIADFLALAGDAVDNIKGVPGVGKKTATVLLEHFGSLEEIYDNLDRVHEVNVRGAKTLGAKLDTHRDDAMLARRLTEIACDAPIEDVEVALQPSAPKLGEINALFDEAGIGTALRRQAERVSDIYRH